ncbi:methyl-accepting chemotaxis protein [Paraburkholderia sp. A1RI_3L]|uniref:methyl-accepting chemotaxis protein n=1 Tax=Paraburkholderia TaxID=1822464 RepID=UPI000F863AB2|nr:MULTISPECIES: methyl-accepting chemotaxis protein [Paraburkholderia]WEY41899.1 methyl-accepting chemotaxis protein [Paraburkholderia sp. SUR17]
MFSRLSITARLFATLGLVGMLTIATGLLGQVGMRSSNEALKEAYSHQLASSIAIGKANLNLTIVRTTLDRVLLHPDSPDRSALIDKALNYLAVSDRAWADYQHVQRGPDEQALADAVSNARSTFLQQAILPMIDAMKRGDHDAADKIAMTVVPPFSVALTKSSDALAAWQLKAGQDAFDSAQQQSATLRGAGIALIVLGLVMCVVCAIGLQRSISRPLSEVLAHLQRIARGDLTNRLEARSHDEMGQLVKGLGAMQSGLVETVQQVMRGSESITQSTREIAAGNNDLSQRTEEQAASLQETAASMEQLTSTVKQNADNARQAHGLAEQASQITARGATVVSDVIGTMSDIDRSSQRIVDIIGVIEGIAFQTNILALNAAVEAARAGEQGRGFAVVASEVRSLAQRSAVAAKEIKELIGDSVDRVTAGSRLVGTAGETMEEIRRAIAQVAGIMNEISAASNEQSDGIEQVNVAVSQMDQVSQQNAALVEQASAAAMSLEEQASALQQAVSKFRLAY